MTAAEKASADFKSDISSSPSSVSLALRLLDFVARIDPSTARHGRSIAAAPPHMLKTTSRSSVMSRMA
jgi:hypothetical protein